MRGAIFSFALLQASANQVNPVEKVIQLLDSLSAKITKEGEVEAKAFKEFVAWCDDAAANTKFAIKTATAEQEKLEATIEKAAADKAASESEIDDLAGAISKSDSDLKEATEIRDKERADFAAVEAELVDTVDTLNRAIGILEREASKNPALLQDKVDSGNMKKLLQVLSTVVDAASLASSDRKKLMALVQNTQDDADDDYDSGAPDPAAYKSQSSSIIDILDDLKEKAETELADARKAESNAAHNFAMLKQSLEDQIAADTKDMNDAKTTKATAEETSATATGDLALAVKDLANAKENLATVGTDCMSSAADHELSLKSRAEELKAIATAKNIIQESTAGATEQQYSFLQSFSVTTHTSHLRTKTDLVNFELVNMVKKLARQQHSEALSQLASRISAVVHYGTSAGEDPFAKVKSLITDMIAKLEAAGEAEATQKAYCDEEMAKTAVKKEELTSKIGKLSTKIDKAASTSAKLKEEVAELSSEMGALMRSQAEMDKARNDERAAFNVAKTDLEQGLAGIQSALQVLRDYYGGVSAAALVQDMPPSFLQQPSKPIGHSKASGAGSSIIGMLEVIESDFSKSLTEATVAEDNAESTYQKQTKENQITKAMKEQDVKYKSAEAKRLAKDVTEFVSDKAGLNTQLSAVLEYTAKLEAQCIAKPDTYEERSKRRAAEIAGLKEALQILESETTSSLLQGKGGRRERFLKAR